MTRTHYADATGLSPHNVSTANDLAIVVEAAAQYPLIREFTTTGSHYVEVQPSGQWLGFNNTNNLVKNAQWDIQLSKTGYIREAGKCLVMMATIAQPPVRHRAARFGGSLHAPGRCRPRSPLARDR